MIPVRAPRPAPPRKAVSPRTLVIASTLAAAFALSSAPVRADVMEVGPDTAVWVAGDLAGVVVYGEAPSQSPAQLPDPGSLAVPEAMVADIAAHASFVPGPYVAKIAELSRRFDLSPSLLEAVVWQESRWRENAVSHAGARGLAQLMPGTARYLGVDPDDPMDNLEGGARYLREQLDRFDGDLEKALAAYNAGPARVIRAGGVPNIRETKAYVAAIMGRLAGHARVENAR